jgi:hypothetical protein
VFVDALFELFEPFLVAIQYRKHSFSCFVFIILLNRYQADLFARKDPATELSTCFHKDFFLSIEGLSLGLEQRSTPL